MNREKVFTPHMHARAGVIIGAGAHLYACVYVSKKSYLFKHLGSMWYALQDEPTLNAHYGIS